MTLGEVYVYFLAARERKFLWVVRSRWVTPDNGGSFAHALPLKGRPKAN